MIKNTTIFTNGGVKEYITLDVTEHAAEAAESTENGGGR